MLEIKILINCIEVNAFTYYKVKLDTAIVSLLYDQINLDHFQNVLDT